MKDKILYSYEKYIEDLNLISPIMQDIDHIVAIYRGSLPMGVHLSNLYNIPLSIIDFQSRDGDSSDVTWMKNLLNDKTKRVLVIDDIYDSGLTMDKVQQFLGNIPDRPDFYYLTIYGKENKDDVNYLREHTGEWINFYWEVL